jgi:hypothetical protein
MAVAASKTLGPDSIRRAQTEEDEFGEKRQYRLKEGTRHAAKGEK